MFTRENFEKQLRRIASGLEKTVRVVAVGSTALAFLGLKTYTKDTDYALLTHREFKAFTQAMEKIGYVSPKITGRRSRYEGEIPTDLHLATISDIRITESILKRCIKKDIGKNLKLYILGAEDALLLKSLGTRPHDLEDIESILQKYSIKWEIITQEIGKQVKEGASEYIILSLGEKLEKLKKKGLNIPNHVLTQLWKMLK